MRNRISHRKIVGAVVLIIIFSALLTAVRAEKIPRNKNDTVRVLILSRHIRLLKEERSKPLTIFIPKNGEMDISGKRTQCGTVTISWDSNALNVKGDGRLSPEGNCIIYPKERGDTFNIDINGEKRTYPLPLYIKSTGNDAELSVEEKIDRFSIDSAWAELGETPERDSEALYALAHLIKARCSLPYLKNKHAGYDFCDLTCCQAYRGISGKVFTDKIFIKTANISNGLFFHSSSGGVLFTESVFNGKERNSSAPKDVIYSENITLGREKFLNWDAVILEEELAQILYPDKKQFLKNLAFDKDKEIVTIETGNGIEKIPPETFRIKVNRVKGWNFLKSNNYILTRANGEYKFRGSGLGHGVGMSFEGAVQLAGRGYSRYEILEHYYPGLEYSKPDKTAVNQQLQYILFSTETGETIKSSSSAAFRNRAVPCGSIFKLFIALYLADKRKDIFYNYSFICTEREKDKLMPDYCWKKSGHGKMNISSALFNSCNKYFASLYSRIDPEDFKIWIAEFTLKRGIELVLPGFKQGNSFPNLLAGINFRATITIDGIIKLNRYLYLENMEHPSGETGIIFSALKKTFTEGTASEDKNIVMENTRQPAGKEQMHNLWGKTGTVIAGTNNHYGYGIFTGGLSSTGIVAILRKGTGAMAARESELILLSESKNNSAISVSDGH